jgi:K+-transporting ATPase A subunit
VIGRTVGFKVIVGGLTFFPALAPVAEHLVLQSGLTF